MLKSFAIKTNEKKIIAFLLKNFEELNLEGFFLSHRTFSNYENIILHYTKENIELFTDKIANILTTAVVVFYEKILLQNILNENYFYFSENEQKEIINLYMNLSEDFEYIIFNEWIQYIQENKSIVLEGFIRFRMFDYIKEINLNLDNIIKKYLIDKEYFDFIKLLQEYIFFSPSTTEILHLIYSPNEYILLNEHLEVITINSIEKTPKYISDISFSNNDFCLNTLLYFLPKCLYIHLLAPKDNFILTLELIFRERICILNS